jgi:hypothetical protein
VSSLFTALQSSLQGVSFWILSDLVQH